MAGKKTESNDFKDSNVKVPLTAAAKRMLVSYTESRDTKQASVIAKLISWFVRQPDSVRSVVMGYVDEDMTLAYAAALRRMANELERSASSPVIHSAPFTETTLDTPGDEPEANPRRPQNSEAGARERLPK